MYPVYWLWLLLNGNRTGPHGKSSIAEHGVDSNYKRILVSGEGRIFAFYLRERDLLHRVIDGACFSWLPYRKR